MSARTAHVPETLPAPNGATGFRAARSDAFAALLARMRLAATEASDERFSQALVRVDDLRALLAHHPAGLAFDDADDLRAAVSRLVNLERRADPAEWSDEATIDALLHLIGHRDTERAEETDRLSAELDAAEAALSASRDACRREKARADDLAWQLAEVMEALNDIAAAEPEKADSPRLIASARAARDLIRPQARPGPLAAPIGLDGVKPRIKLTPRPT